MAETLWYRHRENGSLHEVVKGSESHRRCLAELTPVDIEAGEVPEPVFEAVSAAEVKKAQGSPEKVPGYTAKKQRGPRRGTVIVQQPAAAAAGPSEDEIQARIDAAASAAAAAAVTAFAEQLNELDDKTADPAKTAESPAPSPSKTKE